MNKILIGTIFLTSLVLYADSPVSLQEETRRTEDVVSSKSDLTDSVVFGKPSSSESDPSASKVPVQQEVLTTKEQSASEDLVSETVSTEDSSPQVNAIVAQEPVFQPPINSEPEKPESCSNKADGAGKRNLFADIAVGIVSATVIVVAAILGSN